MVRYKNKGEKLFFHLLYHLLKLLTKVALWVYYSRTTIINRKYLNTAGPVILVANHPNMLLDPLNVVSRVNRTVHFLANASLLNGRMGWFFRRFFCIPVERHQDVVGRKINNEANFLACREFLSEGGCLFIAPQGGSNLSRQLGKLKTGTSRIALDAESQYGFRLGLQVIPVGIVYSAPINFRSEVFINVGRPINVGNYRTVFERDRFEGVRQLTDQIRQTLSALTVDTDNDEEDILLKGIEILHESEAPLAPLNSFFRTKELYLRLTELKENQTALFSTLKSNIYGYFSQLNQYDCSDKIIATYNNNKQNVLHYIFYVVYMVLGFPVFVFGWINNFLPCFIPGVLADRLDINIGYSSTVKMLSGLFTFPLFYGIQTLLVHWLFQNSLLTIFYTIGLLPLGYFAWAYKAYIQSEFELFVLRVRRSRKAEILKKSRNEILDDLFNLNLLMYPR